MDTRLDHLVVVAATLDEGVAWCEATLGITPAPGGRHVIFGTHNRVLRIASRAYARAYLEIIAVDPGATTEGRRAGPRWFDMDDASMHEAVRRGPRLVHWVAATDNLDGALAAWQRCAIDRGHPLDASRDTPQGLLRWRITVRDDGARRFDGALPTLIQWRGSKPEEGDSGGMHPSDALPASGVDLVALRITHPRADELRAAFAAVDLGGVSLAQGAANLAAELVTPKGRLLLESLGA